MATDAPPRADRDGLGRPQARPSARLRRPRPPRAVLAAALVLVGAGAIVTSLAFGGDPQPRRLGANLAVNAGAGDLRDISAHNTPALVRNPAVAGNVVIADRIDGPRYSCALHVSTDGGASFAQTPLPVPPGEEPKCYAPDVTFGADGTLYLAFVTLSGRGNVPHAAWISTSKDGGRTLSAPRRALGARSFGVRIVADPRIAGRIYLTWLRARGVGLYRFSAPGNPIVAARSDDGGRTWSAVARVSSGSRDRVVAPAPAIARDGTLYVAYLDAGDDVLDYEGGHGGYAGAPYDGTWSLVLSRSTDEGATWGETVVAPRVVPTQRFIAFIPPTPALAADGRHVYAAYADGAAGDADVRVWRSADGGASWRATRVNDTPRGDGRLQYEPQLAVAPGGRVDVAYYDRRRDPRDVHNDVSLQSSFDDGATFSPSVRLTDRAFDAAIAPGLVGGVENLGSRIALLATDARTLAVWSDTRAGTRVSGKQDLEAEVVGFAAPARIGGGALAALRAGGGTAVLAGILLFVLPALPSRTRLR